MRARVNAESVNAAIDQTKDDILNQLRKHKQLHRRVLRRGGAASTLYAFRRGGIDQLGLKPERKSSS